MTSAIHARREAEDGFTLIELLVVVIIIGILAAIAIPAFLNQRERAYVSAAESDARNAAIAFETAFTAADEYPTSDDYLAPGSAFAICDNGAGSVAIEATACGTPANEVATFVTSDNVEMAFVNGTTSFQVATDHVLRDSDGAGTSTDDVDGCYLSASGGITAVTSCTSPVTPGP